MTIQEVSGQEGGPVGASDPLSSTPPERGLRGRVQGALARRVNFWDLVLLPALCFMLVAFCWPLVTIFQRSLEPTPGQFIDILQDPGFRAAVARTLKVCLLSTGISVVLGYPFAYAMAVSGRFVKILLVSSLLMATWTSLLIRTYAITIMFGDNGVINRLLIGSGLLADPVPLIRNEFAVVAATVQILLPFTILPIYLRLRTFDTELIEAATSLGATRASVFWRIVFPLTISSVAAGAVFGFILSIGFFIIGQLVGSPGDYLVSQGIQEQIQAFFAPNVAAAMSVVLLAFVVLFLIFVYAVLRLGKFGAISDVWQVSER